MVEARYFHLSTTAGTETHRVWAQLSGLQGHRPQGAGRPPSTSASRSWTISRKRAHQEPRVLRGPALAWPAPLQQGEHTGAHQSKFPLRKAMRRDRSAGSPATTPLWGREAPTGETSGRTQHGRQLCKAGPRGLGAALRGGQSQRRVPEGLAANAVRATPEPPPDTARTERKQALNQASTH